ncbi:UDP-N-acetylmuramate--L-alanine ligase [Mangrovimonas spongiae]|uniref:UDP-N-acetylmuramate--L-alanine ligase n=1 Tax=Mangrovimonas spongiae TaxID=2494697 RepID=A0A428K6K8_9FLAO|nr:UDP-N-acetylmuramate--L-alanine ligase [Mangrovimonas spongiae]RSK41961.1 UDP-N-acetylmuramate--L-alanine ligase [Mangrovimonas spongiae]
MNINQIHSVYFIGIGGVGMSALARYFHANNKQVSGYDKTPTEITKGLTNLGIEIHFQDNLDLVNLESLNKATTLIVYTPAIPKTHTELNYFINQEYQVMKRSQVLGLITQNTFCFAVAGTHGKTTTTSILAHLLYSCNVPLTAFLGGFSENYQSNYITNGTEVTVVEADEFDRSFLTLSPNLACITSMDADHLDIYGNSEALSESFKDFASKVKEDGKLFVKNGLTIKGITYGIEDESDYTIQNITIEQGSYVFDVKTPKTTINNIKFNLPGRHNLSNALIALAMAVEYGCPHQQLAKALASYKGVKRRFTYHIKTNNLVYVDDYAHHPEEIKAVYQAVTEMFPKQKNVIVFQPHLFSRTRDFVNEFAESLSLFDEVFLLDIYPAREEPIQGVDSKWLLDKISNPNKKLITKKNIVEEVLKTKASVVLTVGAGDIGAEVEHVKKGLELAG